MNKEHWENKAAGVGREQILGKPESGEQQLETALDKIESETGIARAVLDKSPYLRRMVFLALAAFSFILGPEAKAQAHDSLSNEDAIENIDKQAKLDQALKDLIQGFIEKKVFSNPSASGFHFASVGPYEVEYYDRNKNDQLDQFERANLSYKDDQGSRIIIRRNADGVTAIAINEQAADSSFQKMTYGQMLNKYQVILSGKKLEEDIYIKDLSPEEVEGIIAKAQTL